VFLSSQPVKVEAGLENVISLFNKDVFTHRVLRSYLTEAYYKEFLDCLANYKVFMQSFSGAPFWWLMIDL